MATAKKVATKVVPKKGVIAQANAYFAAIKAAKTADDLRIKAMLSDVCAKALKDVGAVGKPMEITNMRWLSVYALRYSDYTAALTDAERYKNDAKKQVLATRRAAARYKKFEELHNHLVTSGLKSDAAKKKALAERGLGQ